MSRELLRFQLEKLRRFLIVGVIAAGVDIGGMQALIALGLEPFAARALSLPLAMLCAWRLNRRYTFGASGRSQAGEAVRYAMIAAAAALTNYLVFVLALTLFSGLWPPLAASAGIATSMWVSFFGFQFFAFSQAHKAAAN